MSARQPRYRESKNKPTNVIERFPPVMHCAVEVEQWTGAETARSSMENLVAPVSRVCRECDGDAFDPLPVIKRMVKHRRTHMHQEVPCPSGSASCGTRLLYRIAITYQR